MVLSRDAMRFCVYQLDSELWDHNTGRFLVNSAGAMSLAHWSADEFGRMATTIEKLRRLRWWRRRRWLEQSCDDWQRLAVARCLVGSHEDAAMYPYVRVPTAVFPTFARDFVARPAEHDPTSDSLGRELIYTDAYCEWVQRGGCPDLGRYLGMFWLNEA
jgi:hypothetical protein